MNDAFELEFWSEHKGWTWLCTFSEGTNEQNRERAIRLAKRLKGENPTDNYRVIKPIGEW